MQKSVSVKKGFGYNPVGLRNIGNTCYMNSILQCVFGTTMLSEYFMSGRFSKEQKHRSCRLAEAYYETLKKAHSSGSVITPSDLKSAVARRAP
jgi:ubiquitin carboxyl-terminal hydrolase 8